MYSRRCAPGCKDSKTVAGILIVWTGVIPQKDALFNAWYADWAASLDGRHAA